MLFQESYQEQEADKMAVETHMYRTFRQFVSMRF